MNQLWAGISGNKSFSVETRQVRRGIERFPGLTFGASRDRNGAARPAGLRIPDSILLGGASPPSLVRLGAGVLHDGLFEFHPGRLLGSMMLHGNLIHVAVNGLALHIAGGSLRGFMVQPGLMVLALSGVAGALASHFSGVLRFPSDSLGLFSVSSGCLADWFCKRRSRNCLAGSTVNFVAR